MREPVILDIEGDDYSACGGEFEVRGHIRVLAAAVGADPGPLIAAYDSARRGGPALAGEVTEPIPQVRVPPGRSGPVTPAATGGRRRRPALVVALGVVLVAGLGVAGYLLADPGGGGAPSAGAPTATASQAGRATRAASAPSATGSPRPRRHRRPPRPAPGRAGSLPSARPRSDRPAARATTATWPALRSMGIPPRRGIPTGIPPPGSGICIRAPACWWTWAVGRH